MSMPDSWIKGHHTPGGCPVDPFPFERKPMPVPDYDGVRDSIKDAYLRDRDRIPEFLDAALAHIGSSACSGVEPDNLAAAAFLRELEIAARSGVPMNERGERL